MQSSEVLARVPVHEHLNRRTGGQRNGRERQAGETCQALQSSREAVRAEGATGPSQS